MFVNKFFNYYYFNQYARNRASLTRCSIAPVDDYKLVLGLCLDGDKPMYRRTCCMDGTRHFYVRDVNFEVMDVHM